MQTTLKSRKKPLSTTPSASARQSTPKRSASGSTFRTEKFALTILHRWEQWAPTVGPERAGDFYNWYKHLLDAGLSPRVIHRSNLDDLTIPMADRMELLKDRLRKRADEGPRHDYTD